MNNIKEINYFSKNWNFNFFYPNNWKIIYENEPAGSWVIPIAIASPKHENVIASFMVNARDGEILQPGQMFVPGPNGMIKMPSTPYEYIEMEKNSLPSQFPNFIYVSGNVIQIDNKKAAHQIYRYQGQFCEVTEESVTIFAKGQTFQIIMEIPSIIYNSYYKHLKSILSSFHFGPPIEQTNNIPYKEEKIKSELSFEQKYNEAVSLYKKAKYKDAKDAFAECVKANIYKLQSAYAYALCQEELGEEPTIKGLNDNEENIAPKVYLSTNIASYILKDGYPAALPKNGEVNAEIKGEQYIISIANGFGFGGFFKNAWKKQGDQTIPISDSSKNPNPTENDQYILNILKSSKITLPSPLPDTGLQTDILKVTIPKINIIQTKDKTNKKNIDTTEDKKNNILLNQEKSKKELPSYKKYNEAVSLYKKAKYKDAKDAFAECVKANIYKLQSAYAYALCQEELGEEPTIKGLNDNEKNIAPKVYLSTNIASYILKDGYPAALPKNGEVNAEIKGEQYIISIANGFGFGGFFKNAWKKQCDQTIPIADSSKNPYPTENDQYILNVLRDESLIKPCLLPKNGLSKSLSKVIMAKCKTEPKQEKFSHIPMQNIEFEIGGWLYLPAIIIFAQFLKLFSVIDEVMKMNSLNEIIYWPSMIANIFIIIFATFLTYFFLKRKKITPMLFICFLLFTSEIWCIILLFFPATKFIPNGKLYTGIEPSAMPFSISLIWSLILIPCFLVSKRVKNTFVEEIEPQKFPENIFSKISQKLLPLENFLRNKGFWNFLITPFIQGLLIILTLITGTTISWIYDNTLQEWFSKHKSIKTSKINVEKMKSMSLPTETSEEISLKQKTNATKESLNTENVTIVKPEKEIKDNIIPLEVDISLAFTKGKDASGFIPPSPNRFSNQITIINTCSDIWHIYPDMLFGEAFGNKSIAKAITSKINQENRNELVPYQIEVCPDNLSGEYQTQVLFPSENDTYTVIMTSVDATWMLNNQNSLWEKTALTPQDKLLINFESLNSSTYSNKMDPSYFIFLLGPIASKATISLESPAYVLYSKSSNISDINIIETKEIIWIPLTIKGIKQYIENNNLPDSLKIQLIFLCFDFFENISEINKFVLSYIENKNASEIITNSIVKMFFQQNEPKIIEKLIFIAKATNYNKILRLAIINNLFKIQNLKDENVLMNIVTSEFEDWDLRIAAFNSLCKKGGKEWLNIYNIIENNAYFKINASDFLAKYEKELSENQKETNKETKFFLAYLYENGILFEEDSSKALPLFLSVIKDVNSLNEDEKKSWDARLGNKIDAQFQWETGQNYEKPDIYQDIKQSFEWYLLAAKQGHSDAQCKIGWWYFDNTINQNPEEAIKWTRLSAEQGNSNAQNNLGVFYDEGYGVDKDSKKALQFYETAANQGNSYAQCNIGLAFEVGRGIEKNYEKAMQWFKLSAENGNARGMCRMGLMYENAYGVKKDLNEAVKCYQKSAEKNNPEGQYNLATMLESGLGIAENKQEAFRYYEKAAIQGHSEAQRNLGRLYKNAIGVKQDYQKAISWYRKAVEQDNKIAMCNLGWMFDNGLGVEKNIQEAAKYYNQAAERGHAISQNNLANMYEKGEGVEKNYATAMKWYLAAANQGDKNAQFTLGKKYQEGIITNQNYEDALKWYKLSADQNFPDAIFKLGFMYYNGYGVEKDYEKAFNFFKNAAEKGVTKAKYNIGILYEYGEGVHKDFNTAMTWYKKAADDGDEDAIEKIKSLNK